MTRNKLGEDEMNHQLIVHREFDACARSYGVSACKLTSQRMLATLPRELRDLVYDHILQDPYIANPLIKKEMD